MAGWTIKISILTSLQSKYLRILGGYCDLIIGGEQREKVQDSIKIQCLDPIEAIEDLDFIRLGRGYSTVVDTPTIHGFLPWHYTKHPMEPDLI